MRTKALVLDVDGVVSPVDPAPGKLPWGDEVEAGHVFGPVLVSPTMCARLDRLAQRPDLTCAWLTSWTPDMRARMTPFPGHTWLDIGELHRHATGGSAPTEDAEWWKWRALRSWLDRQTTITRLVWCDDDISTTGQRRPHQIDLEPTSRATAANQPLESHVQRTDVWGYLDNRRITCWLIAPKLDIGLTPRDLDRIEAFLAPADQRR